jgi:hypothetical protein
MQTEPDRKRKTMYAASFFRRSVITVATLGVMFGSTPIQAQAHILHGSVPASARMAQDHGAVDDSLTLPMVRVYYAPTMEQKASLNQLLADQRNPESSRYHAWLSPEEFGAQFGVSHDNETHIRTWLASQGFSGVQLSRSRTAFTFSTTAGTAARTFAAPIHAVALGGAQFVIPYPRLACHAALLDEKNYAIYATSISSTV